MTVSITVVAACVSITARDPAEPLHAAIHRWEYPVSREWMLLANIFDSLEANRIGKKHKPGGRPWPAKGSKKLGRTKMSQKAAIEALRRNRHGETQLNTDA